MRARVFLLVFVLGGCGIVSGLDQLVVDGGVDVATIDAADGGADAVEESVGDAQPPPPDDASGIPCGNNFCTGGTHCCATSLQGSYAYTCVSASCQNGSIALYCVDPLPCKQGNVCCFNGTEAQCNSSTSTACATLLCTSASQCGNNMSCVPFDAGDGLTLAACK